MTEVSPVTEQATMQDIKGWLDRIATAFVGLSAQAAELGRLRQTMEEVNQRLNLVQEENTKLKGEIRDTYDLVTGVERERDEAKRQVQVTEQQLGYLRGENTDKQSRIEQLESEVRRLTDSLAVANRETEDAKVKVVSLEHERDRVLQSRDYWRQQAEESKAEVASTQKAYQSLLEANTSLVDKLHFVQTKLSEVSSLFAQPQPAPVEANPASPPEQEPAVDKAARTWF